MRDLNYKIIAIGEITLRQAKRTKILKISDEKRAVIEKVWQSSLRKNGKLFNGLLLNFAALNISGNKIDLSGNFVEYKQFIADRKRPELKLNIKPIGVSGMIIIKESGINYAILAKRTGKVTDHKSFFELVPSGSIDRKFMLGNGNIDYKAQLLTEFSEETGLPKNYVKKISGFALVLDTSKNIYDICSIILIDKDMATIKKYFTSKEYGNPRFVPLKDLDTFIKIGGNSMVPTSTALIKAYEKFIKKTQKGSLPPHPD